MQREGDPGGHRALAGAGLGGAAEVYKPSEATLELYKAKCQQCHMADGNSPLEPLNFSDGKWIHGTTPKQLALVITNGVPGTAMMSFKERFSDPEILGLAKFVMAFDKTHKAAPAKKPAAKPATN